MLASILISCRYRAYGSVFWRLSGFVAAAVVGSLCFFGVGHAAPSPASGAALGESMPASLGDGTLDGIRKAFETRFPDVAVTGVRQTPYRSEESRVGKECVSTCRSRWSPTH